MAKNWTLREAVSVITDGKNKEAIQELGKRYPITAVAIAKLVMSDGLETIMSAMPDHVTMLKLERSLKDGVEESADDDEEVDDTAGTEEAGDEDLDSMTTKQLYALCVKRGIKANKYGKPKSYYIELLKGGSDQSDENEEDENDDEEQQSGESYEDMNAVDLFKLCKKRGIKAEPKKKAAEYVKLLKAADAADAEEDADEEEDWDEEEKPAPKKPEKKGAGKKEKEKPAAKKESSKKAKADEEDDEDDDWDI